MLKTQILLSAFFFLFLPKAESQQLLFNHLTVENGLSSNSVLAIAQNNTGFLWFGTRTGLCRYDGSGIKTYLHNSTDSTSISNNNVIALFVDSKRRLWVGSSGGLDYYDERNDNFTRISPNNQIHSVNCIYEDRNGIIWVGSTRGLFAITKQTPFAYTSVPANVNNNIAENEVRSVYQDHADNLWVGTTNGLTRMKKVNGQYRFETFHHNPVDNGTLSADYITTITEDAKNNLWIGTQNKGLNLFHTASGKFIRYSKNSNAATGPVNNNIRMLCSDKIACNRKYRDNTGYSAELFMFFSLFV